MDVAATIRNRLLAIDALRTIVSGRVYTGQLPQSPTLPAVLVNGPPGGEPDSHLRGGGTPRFTRITVTSVGQTREITVSVDTALQGDNAGSGLSYWKGTMGSPSANVLGAFPMGNPVPFWDPNELRQYRINRDYMVIDG